MTRNLDFTCKCILCVTPYKKPWQPCEEEDDKGDKENILSDKIIDKLDYSEQGQSTKQDSNASLALSKEHEAEPVNNTKTNQVQENESHEEDELTTEEPEDIFDEYETKDDEGCTEIEEAGALDRMWSNLEHNEDY